MNNQVTVYIYARAAKANAAGLPPIYVRITIQGKRTEFSTKKFVNPTKWDQKTMKLKGNNEEARSINNYLDSIKNKLTQTQVILEYQSTTLTLDNFMNAYQGKSSKRERTLISIFQEHNKKLKALIGIDYSEGTYERYETSLRHTQSYIKHQYGTDDIAIDKIDHAFVTGYDFYLRTEKDCSNNTTVKYIKNFKKIIRICMANGWLSQDPCLNYKVKLQEVERNILTQEELETITEKQITIERLDAVRDIFLFSCFTGLAYIDVKQLTPDNIIKGIDGQLWIDTKRQKTNIPSRIPLLSTALDIIQKYHDHPKCNNENTLLPVASNQKMNAYLKEIATVCGIKKELTFHCARHTFATTVTLSNGVPIESVSKMLGHKSIRTTQHYAKITDSKVANDMDNLKALIEQQKSGSMKKTS
ncbi:site-specific integrase [Sphingobacterium sp. SRCM116780]|uniref:site-specific integrase n=1 Tax=Sphingobacterium sp. SRCM116780 TaxID=2907623 RepID=UPI001F15B0C8|nr:site-specific integrase [Sphingobacterium sp. SRCM116780]UIR56721.1 site-specific integrase [Sphingobacterium sp. SRCM116780]